MKRISIKHAIGVKKTHNRIEVSLFIDAIDDSSAGNLTNSCGISFLIKSIER
jgi:hypothetical protein